MTCRELPILEDDLREWPILEMTCQDGQSRNMTYRDWPKSEVIFRGQTILARRKPEFIGIFK